MFIPTDNRQTGVTMFVTVMLVLVLSLVALAVFQQSAFDEKSARSQQDRQLAMQAAETALRDAEMDLQCLQLPPENSVTQTPVACPGGSVLHRAQNDGDAVRRCRAQCGLGSARTTGAVGYSPTAPVADNAGRWEGPKAKPATAGPPPTPDTPALSPASVRSNWSGSAGNFGSVALGTFTGAPNLALVARQPRYLLELFEQSNPDSPPQVVFRITAKGWGRNLNSEYTVQQLYRP